MTVLGLALERFDAADGPEKGQALNVREQQLRASAYAEGFAAGEAAARDKAAPDEDLLKSLISAFEAQANGFHGQVEAQLCRSLSLLVEKLFPALAEKGLAHEVSAIFSRLNIPHTEEPVSLAINPAQADKVREMFRDFGAGEQIAIVEDDSLSESAAAISWTGGGVHMDIQNAVEECLNALETAAQQLTSENIHE